MWYWYVGVGAAGFLLGFITMSLFAASGAQGRLDELDEARRLIGVLWKRVNDAESLLLAGGRATLYDETGELHVELPVEEQTS